MNELPGMMHVVRIAHGLGASVVCGAIFHLAALVVLPRRWDERLTRGMTPAVIGAALYVLVCWFSLGAGVPVARSAVVFAVAVALLGVIRHRRVFAHVRESGLVKGGAARHLTAGFITYYLAAYLFTLPPATADYLPVAWLGNIDLMTYIRYTRYLLALGPSNLDGFSYFNFVLHQTPGLFFLLGGLSLMFEQDPLSATMPIQFALVAMMGTLVAAVSRAVFKLSSGAALVIGAIFISGPFFRYVTANYFLSTLLATPVVLYLLWTTVEMRARRALDIPIAIRFAAAYVLLLFIYPFLLLAGMGLQIGAVALMLVAELQRAAGVSPRALVLSASRTLTTAAASFTAIAVCFWARLMWSLEMIIGLSEKGVAGWPLDLVSPAAMFAVPGASSDAIQVAAASHAYAFAAFGAVAAVLVAVYFWWMRHRTTPAEAAFAGLLAGTVLLYCAYYSLLGPSYQQWKFASYSALPLSFVLFAAATSLLINVGLAGRKWPLLSAVDRKLAGALPAFVAVALIAGNITAHTALDPRLRRVSGLYRDISEIDALPQFREITVSMQDEHDPLPTWLALYYLPNKKVHVVSSKFKPSEPLSFEHVSRQRPLLLHNASCQGVGHDDTMWIRRVGCLLFEPPTLLFGVTYPFSRTFLFIDYDGLTARQPDGRWNRRHNIPLTLTADPQRAGLDKDVYLNFLVSPSPPTDEHDVKVSFRWGSDKSGTITLAHKEWISLPVKTSDWTGNRLWELPISADFPDRRLVLFHELAFTAAPRGRVLDTATTR